MKTYHDIWLEQLNEKILRLNNGEDIDLDDDEREFLAWKNENLNGKNVDFAKLSKWNTLKGLATSLCEHNAKYHITAIDPTRNAKNATLGFDTGTDAFAPIDSEMSIVTQLVALADNIVISCLEGTINIGLIVRDIWSE